MDIISLQSLTEEQRQRVHIYTVLTVIVLTLVVGTTLSLIGLILTPMMAVSYNILGVVGSVTLLTTGGTLAVAAYLWLTNPFE